MPKPKKPASKKTAPTLPPAAVVHVARAHDPAAEAPAAPRDLSVADAFAAHRHEAAVVTKEQAAEFQADLTLALHNARIGVAAVKPHAARVAAELPSVPLARVLGLTNYVRGAMYAESKSASPRKVTGDDITEKLTLLQEIRIPALFQLQVFKLKKLAPAATVDAIVEGRGTLNFAQDGIDIERVFTENRAAWANKHPFTDEEIALAGALGNWLLDHVQPDGATPRPAPSNEYDLLRRQFWSLVTTLHRHLRTAGIVLWGEDGVDAHVPKLQTRQVTRSSGDATAAKPAATPGEGAAPADR